eukprot:COSAG02_NODE_8077_length_2720_cov_1.261732_2_plen_197_part_00
MAILATGLRITIKHSLLRLVSELRRGDDWDFAPVSKFVHKSSDYIAGFEADNRDILRLIAVKRYMNELHEELDGVFPDRKLMPIKEYLSPIHISFLAEELDDIIPDVAMYYVNGNRRFLDQKQQIQLYVSYVHHEITGESNPRALGRAVLAQKTADSGDKRPVDPLKMPGPIYDLLDKQLYVGDLYYRGGPGDDLC